MKSLLLTFFLVTAILFSALAQNIPIGDWRMHLPYNSSNSAAVTKEKVYSSTGFSIMEYNKDDGGLSRLDKVNGLSDIGIDFIEYSEEDGVLFIAYSNSNIDLLFDDNSILNIQELRDPLILGDKKIRDVHFYDHKAYISTGIEILVYDMTQLEFITNFPLGNSGGKIGINGISNDETHLYAATDEGLKRILIDDPNISDFNRWEWMDYTTHKIEQERIDLVESNGKAVFLSIDDTIKYFDGFEWQVAFYEPGFRNQEFKMSGKKLYAVQWLVIGNDFQDHRFITIDSLLDVDTQKVVGLSRPVYVEEDDDGSLWISDFFTGLKVYESNMLTTIKLDGPLSTGAFRLSSRGNRVLVSSGGVQETFENNFNANGLFVFEDGSWLNYSSLYPEELKFFFDVLDSEIDPIDNSLYISSFLSGIARIQNRMVEKIDTTDGLATSVGDKGRVKISGLDFDDQGNLWASNFNASTPIMMRDREGNIFQYTSVGGANNLKNITADSYGQIWLTVRQSGDGIIVFDNNGTPDLASDDLYRRLTTGSGLGDLPNGVVNCVVEDESGIIWIGTEQGIAVFDCPSFIFDDDGCTPRRIIVDSDIDGFNAYLFENEIVRTIAVDGANRKWVGTTNGVWLISSNGEDEIFQFNVDNSPLPSNNVFSITVNDENGEVFIGTELGVVSYRSDATQGSEEHTDVKVFPNPVSPDYLGPIAISGLVDEAFVKITDISGTLIYEAPANGGQAVWNGSDLSGNRARSGVYMVFSSNQDGSEKFVAKILLLN